MIAPLIHATAMLAGLASLGKPDPDGEYRQDDAVLREFGPMGLTIEASDLDRSYDLLATIATALGFTEYDRKIVMDLAEEKARVFSTPAAIVDAVLAAYYSDRAADLALIEEETSEPLAAAA